jgi:sugar lactone lactonase YvrE
VSRRVGIRTACGSPIGPRKRLSAFDIALYGSLSDRQVWADLGDGVPDGICIDEEGAVWYADVPNKRCVRIREGGEVSQTLKLDRGCFACMLGGTDRCTLFMMLEEWLGFDKMNDSPRTGQIQITQVGVPGIGWPH